MQPIKPPSRKTQLEMEAGQRAVQRAALSEEVRALKNAGFKVTPDMDATAIKINYMLASGSNALPGEDRTYHCGICGQDHTKGERCPNSARKHVTNTWAQQ